MKKQTESISIRIESEIKREFFDLLNSQQKTFSKWLRNKINNELNSKKRSLKKEDASNDN